MRYFIKLNIISSLYALMVLIPSELMINVYRMARVTNWEISTVNILIAIILFLEITGGTVVIYYLTKKWLECRKANFWTIILWLPYFIIFIYVFANLVPITYGGDEPNPVTGLLLFAGIVVYPFYILILNLFSMTSDDSVKTV